MILNLNRRVEFETCAAAGDKSRSGRCLHLIWRIAISAFVSGRTETATMATKAPWKILRVNSAVRRAQTPLTASVLFPSAHSAAVQRSTVARECVYSVSDVTLGKSERTLRVIDSRFRTWSSSRDGSAVAMRPPLFFFSFLFFSFLFFSFLSRRGPAPKRLRSLSGPRDSVLYYI